MKSSSCIKLVDNECDDPLAISIYVYNHTLNSTLFIEYV